MQTGEKNRITFLKIPRAQFIGKFISANAKDMSCTFFSNKDGLRIPNGWGASQCHLTLFHLAVYTALALPLLFLLRNGKEEKTGRELVAIASKALESLIIYTILLISSVPSMLYFWNQGLEGVPKMGGRYSWSCILIQGPWMGWPNPPIHFSMARSSQWIVLFSHQQLHWPKLSYLLLILKGKYICRRRNSI